MLYKKRYQEQVKLFNNFFHLFNGMSRCYVSNRSVMNKHEELIGTWFLYLIVKDIEKVVFKIMSKMFLKKMHT